MRTGMKNIAQKVLVGMFAVVGMVTLAGSAHANDCYDGPRYVVKAVTTYEVREQPYRDYVTSYDHCGRPFSKVVIRYRTVRVPVVRLVKVWY